VRKGGSVFFRASSGPNRSYFTMLVALAGHEIDAVEQIYLNDQPVTLDGSGYVQEAPYAIGTTTTGTATADGSGIAVLPHTPLPGTVFAYTGTGGGPDGDANNVNAAVSGSTVTTSPGAAITYQYTAYAYHAQIRAVLGSSTQVADAATIALLPSQWTAAHRARGVAYLVCTFYYGESAFPNGLPVVSAVIRGAKVYDPRENMLTYSEQFDHANWTKISCTVTANGQAAPNGLTTADTLVSTFTGGSNECFAQETSTVLSGTDYTYSVYLKQGTSPVSTVDFYAVSPYSEVLAVVTWGPTPSLAVGGSALIASGMVDVGGGWYRVHLSMNTGPATSVVTRVYVRDQGSANLTGETVHVWGAQLVAGAAPKAYTATTSSAIAPTTAWSQNPALQLRHVYQHASFGKATVSTEEDDRIILAANACDTSTNYVVGGVTVASPLYRASLVVPYGAAPRDVFDDLAQSMGGSWAFAGGQLHVRAGVYTAPVMALTEADLAVVERNGASESQRPISISVHRERAQKFNTVNVTIWDQQQAYKQVTLTPLVGSALVTRDGAALAQAVTYSAIGYAPQALHVAGIMMRDARDPLTVALPFKLKAYPLELFDNVT
jgi:hypothetical protein